MKLSTNRYIRAAIASLAITLLSVGLAACEPTDNTTTRNAAAVEGNQQRLQNAIPSPRLQTSLERKNLVERLERINQQNMSGYIYLISKGSIISEFPIRGKITSLNAYLQAETAPQRFSMGGGNYTTEMVEQPDFDGAYGKNAEGVFFFTADTNAYVEWYGEYLFSDQPLRLSQKPLMVRNVADN